MQPPMMAWLGEAGAAVTNVAGVLVAGRTCPVEDAACSIKGHRHGQLVGSELAAECFGDAVVVMGFKKGRY